MADLALDGKEYQATPKQVAFAYAYLELGSASEAYRQAKGQNNMQDKTINEAASRLLSNSKVVAILSHEKAKLAQKSAITVETLCDELEKDRQLARDNGQAGAAMTATMDIAKLHGLLIEKRQLQQVGNDKADNMTDAQLEAIARQGLKLVDSK